MKYTQSTDNISVAVIGGGAAGLMAAGTALLYGANVTVFDHSGRLGKKLAITGKGRCNVTNKTTVNGILENVTTNARFLYGALNAFTPDDTVSFFEGLGVPLKTERGNRVFPESDKAIDIVNALKEYAAAAEYSFSHVKRIKKNEDGSFTVTADKDYIYDRVILATGGKSYARTGSDGSGYSLAIRLGHTVSALKPSLIPLESPSPLCESMQGLSLKNVAIKVTDETGKTLYNDFGEMMFTHFGLTGPIILSASAHLKERDINGLTVNIDLKPALDEPTLDKRLIEEFKVNSNKDFINVLGSLLPSKMIRPFISTTGIDERKKVNLITKEERKKIICCLKEMAIPISGTRPIEEAIITSGGVSVKEISPKTMESKLQEGLYLAGEIIDVDAYTGGFNLQIAFSTGYVAGLNAATEQKG